MQQKQLDKNELLKKLKAVQNIMVNMHYYPLDTPLRESYLVLNASNKFENRLKDNGDEYIEPRRDLAQFLLKNLKENPNPKDIFIDDKVNLMKFLLKDKGSEEFLKNNLKISKIPALENGTENEKKLFLAQTKITNLTDINAIPDKEVLNYLNKNKDFNFVARLVSDPDMKKSLRKSLEQEYNFEKPGAMARRFNTKSARNYNEFLKACVIENVNNINPNTNIPRELIKDINKLDIKQRQEVIGRLSYEALSNKGIEFALKNVLGPDKEIIGRAVDRQLEQTKQSEAFNNFNKSDSFNSSEIKSPNIKQNSSTSSTEHQANPSTTVVKTPMASSNSFRKSIQHLQERKQEHSKDRMSYSPDLKTPKFGGN